MPKNTAPTIVWERIQKYIEYDPEAFLLFDDSVSDKNHAHAIELVPRQSSGTACGLSKGIDVVNCLYVNPRSGHCWVIDWRVFAPQTDHKTKLQHVQEMFDEAMAVKRLPFRVVLMDFWHATKELMVHVHHAGKIFYCPLKSNRLVDDSQAQAPYQAVSGLHWNEQGAAHGKFIKVHQFPGTLKVKLFRVATGNGRTEWVVTNDLDQVSVEDTRQICAIRWKIGQGGLKPEVQQP